LAITTATKVLVAYLRVHGSKTSFKASRVVGVHREYKKAT